MKSLFEMLAAYNSWVNERLYEAAARIPDAEYRRDRGAFFGSLHGTLNHLLVGDRIWMHRFTGEGEVPRELAGTIRYHSTRSPADLEQHLAPLLLHFFNHQTHHRGQAHCLLTEITGEAPSFDLLIYQRQTGAGMIKGQGGDFSTPERRQG